MMKLLVEFEVLLVDELAVGESVEGSAETLQTEPRLLQTDSRRTPVDRAAAPCHQPGGCRKGA